MSSSTRIDELWKKFEENPRRYFAPLANEHRKAGDLEQAIAICQAHLPQQPGHISGHIVLGQALFEKGELDESARVFETALGLDPENLIALRTMGDIARQVGDAETARLWYERVLDVDPRNDEITTLIRELEQVPLAPAAADAPAGDDFVQSESYDDPHMAAPAAESLLGGTALPDESAPMLDDVLGFAGSPAAAQPAEELDLHPLDMPLIGGGNYGSGAGPASDPEYAVSDAATPHEPEPLPDETFAPQRGAWHAEEGADAFPEFSDESMGVTGTPSAQVHEPPGESRAAEDGMRVSPFEGEIEGASPAPGQAAAPAFGEFEAMGEDLGDLEAAAEPEQQPQAQIADAWAEAEPESAAPSDGSGSPHATEEDWFAGIPGDELHVEAGTVGGLEPAEFSADDARSIAGGGIEGLLVEEPGFHLTPSYGNRAIEEPDPTEAAPEAFHEPTPAPDSLETLDAMLEATREEIAAGQDLASPPADAFGEPSSPTSFDVEPEVAEEPEHTEAPVDAFAFDAEPAYPEASAQSVAFDAEPAYPEASAQSVAFDAEPAYPEAPAQPVAFEEEPAGLPEPEFTGSFASAEPAADEALVDVESAAGGLTIDAEQDAASVHYPAPGRATPAIPIEAVVPAPPAFVTETMAELYLQQGFREEALAVYRELLSRHPGDAELRARVAHIEAGESAVRIDDFAGHVVPESGPSIRTFFARIAQRRPPERPYADAVPPRRPTPSRLAAIPVAGAPDAAAPPVEMPISALFPDAPPVHGGEERAASALAAAYGANLPAGEATRAASGELSLSSVFGDTPSEPRRPAAAGDFSFDQFFASPEPAPDAGSAAAPAARAEERQQDIEQFTAWLEGLKRK